MKKALVVLVIVILALLIIGAIAWKLFKPSAPAAPATQTAFPTSPLTSVSTEQEPNQFAAAFYTWYFVNYINEYGRPDIQQQIQAHLPNWLTPAFAAQLPTIISQTGADPFFLAQDAPPTDSKITAAIVSQSGSVSDVAITFTSSSSVFSYLVHLQKIEGAWRIDSVSKGS